jgi:hypothetical protein
MQLPLSQQGQQSASNATGATSGGFIETVEYDRFIVLRCLQAIPIHRPLLRSSRSWKSAFRVPLRPQRDDRLI